MLCACTRACGVAVWLVFVYVCLRALVSARSRASCHSLARGCVLFSSSHFTPSRTPVALNAMQVSRAASRLTMTPPTRLATRRAFAREYADSGSVRAAARTVGVPEATARSWLGRMHRKGRARRGRPSCWERDDLRVLRNALTTGARTVVQLARFLRSGIPPPKRRLQLVRLLDEAGQAAGCQAANGPTSDDDAARALLCLRNL
jgi:transposase